MLKYLIALFTLTASFCCAEFQIVESFSTTFFIEMHGFLIYDTDSAKYNFYTVDYFEISYPFKADIIVQIFEPVSLEIAQNNYPSYNLTNLNYGFTYK